jgi:hypothetical protein
VLLSAVAALPPSTIGAKSRTEKGIIGGWNIIAFSHQPSAISLQLSAISLQLWAISPVLLIAQGCRPQALKTDG